MLSPPVQLIGQLPDVLINALTAHINALTLKTVGLCETVMGKELRFYQLRCTNTSTTDKVNSFTNTTDALMHIRRIDAWSEVEQANVESTWRDQLTKSASYVSEASSEIPPTFDILSATTNYAVTVPTTDASGRAFKSWTFARDQLTLEPGEALHVHILQGTVNAGTKVSTWTIAFEY